MRKILDQRSIAAFSDTPSRRMTPLRSGILMTYINWTNKFTLLALINGNGVNAMGV